MIRRKLKSMKRNQLLLLSSLLASLALAGCEVASKGPPTAPATQAAAPATTTPAATPAKTAIACPSQDFEVFLKAFADDVEVQKAHTQRPLQSESVDPNADPEPKQVTAMLDGDALKFPVMPSSQTQKNDGLVLSQTELNGDKQVMLAKPDTDYQLSFFFRKGECWTLYRKRDDSL
ncbi:hypothetical protein [Lysobacter sp. Root690]|uniref:hypothetical protein n=1 Tax=Lysobacter sp. Root690 TaxID=1736588 RepID=UPI0006FFE4D1|nr:hypothetical protein [Lysobacter sp. Root690]KRB04011.1 hypothetical protein ASD86_16760 [Lysobacter sp. Root690]